MRTQAMADNAVLNYIQYKNGKLTGYSLDDTPFFNLQGVEIGRSQKQDIIDKLAAFDKEDVTIYGEIRDNEFVVFAVMLSDVLLGTDETKVVASYLKFKFEDVGDTFKINEIEKMKLGEPDVA